MQGEYRGDFTRDTFNPLKNFSRVLMQQGRVQLDADWNEQTAILLHHLRSLAADLIGQHAGPIDNPGFDIQPIGAATKDFLIGAGRYYIDGILCEPKATRIRAEVIAVEPPATPNRVHVSTLVVDDVEFGPGQWVELLDPTGAPFAPPSLAVIDTVDASAQTLTVKGNFPAPTAGGQLLRRLTTYMSQPDYPTPIALQSDNAAAPSNHLVYLDVWERHIVCNQDSQIREVALGGPDTASRAKVVCQVRITSTQPDNGPILSNKRSSVYTLWPDWVEKFQPHNRGMLRARVQPQAISTDPCTTSPESRFRGAENQLYRVEIHTAGLPWKPDFDRAGNAIVTGNEATFKWSRENGSVIFPISKISGTQVSIANFGRDTRLSLNINDWVEVIDDHQALSLEPTALLQVRDIDRIAMTVTLSGAVNERPTKSPLLRRWDHRHGDSKNSGLTLHKKTGSALIPEGVNDQNWLNLEDGIQIQFQPGASYRSGDYWLIPAPVATGDIEWPRFRDAHGNPVLDPTTRQPIPDALPPHGVEHHYAPLAIISVDEQGNVSDTPANKTDLRNTFKAGATPIA